MLEEADESLVDLTRAARDVPGDRRQELVFIGSGMDETYIRASLDACLATSENGFNPRSWRNLSDPFPPWHYPDHLNQAT